MTTKKQQKREQRQRDKEARRRMRQEREWKRQNPRLREVSTEDRIAEIQRMEAKGHARRSNLGPLSLAAAMIALYATTETKETT